jgi:cation diffusion facilitator family transporter
MWTKEKEKMTKANAVAMKKLGLVAVLTSMFIVVEIVGSSMSGSLAILTEAAHLATDVLGIVVSMIGLHIAKKDATEKYSFGFHRAELLATLFVLSALYATVFHLCQHSF